MTMPQQLPQITILPTRHPDPRKAIFQQPSQNQLRILAIRLLLAYSLRADLGGIPDPQLEIDRTQIFLRTTDVESLIAEDHPVRAIWIFLGRLDLSKFSEEQRAVEGSVDCSTARKRRSSTAIWRPKE